MRTWRGGARKNVRFVPSLFVDESRLDSKADLFCVSLSVFDRADVYPLENMPFGVSFVARKWDEHTLLKVGRAYEIAVGGPQVWREEGWKRIRKGVEVVSGWD